jgi:hypothetical protein
LAALPHGTVTLHKLIFGIEREKVYRRLEKMHNEARGGGDEIKEDEMGGVCTLQVRSKKCSQNFHRKHEGKRPLGTQRRRWD